MKIWERAILLNLFLMTLFVLIGLFGVYVLIDLSIHSVRFFSDGSIPIKEISLYYFYSFSLHVDLFFDFALLLSALKVYFQLTFHFESVALQMAGLSKKRLSRPLFVLSIFFCLLSLSNAEWLTPSAQESIDSFRYGHDKRKKSSPTESIHSVVLDDGSEIVYQNFQSQKKILSDAFWLKKTNDFWHFQQIDFTQTPLIGEHVDHFESNENGQIYVSESFEKRTFPELPLEASDAIKRFIPFENRSLSTLIIESFGFASDSDRVHSHLLYKLSLPLIPFLIATIIPPILLRYSRQTPTFLIITLSLFALIAWMTILDGLLIWSENRVLSPFFAIVFPSLCIFIFAIRRFLKCS